MAAGESIAVSRFGVPRVPDKDLTVQDGDILHFSVVRGDVARPARRAQEDRAARMTRKTMRIAIAGAGNVGTFVAAGPARPRATTSCSSSRTRTADRTRRDRSLDVNWVNGDACEIHTLDAAVLSSCEVVVAATGDDEDNLVDLAARQAGVRRPARGRAREPSGQRVAVHGVMGRRRRGQHAAPPDLSGRGGRLASATWCGC